jgi:hypothetical protein
MLTDGGKKQAFKGEHHSRHGLLWVGLDYDGGGEIRQFDEREIKRVLSLVVFFYGISGRPRLGGPRTQRLVAQMILVLAAALSSTPESIPASVRGVNPGFPCSRSALNAKLETAIVE